MTLKEYVVYEGYKGIFGIKTKAAWESYLEQCDTRKIPDSERFRIITTFNADEQLQEQNGLRTSAKEILKAIYEKRVAANPKENWASWEKCVEDGTVDMVVEAMEAYATAEPGQPVPAGEWISVDSGKLPEKRIRVITWDGFIHSDAYVDFDGKWKWTHPETRGEAWQDANMITHWRPLPAPPSPKQEDNQ